jgi:effector-binding domain-containing protein
VRRDPFVTCAMLVVIGGCAAHPRADPVPVNPPVATRPSTGPLTKPVLPPLTQPSFHVSPATLEAAPAIPAYAYVPATTTFREIERAVDAATAELTAADAAGKLKFAGPAVFVYRGVTMEPDKPFSLEVGFPVAEGAKPMGKILVRPLPAMKAIGVTFDGPLSAVDKAYDRLVPELFIRGLQPTGETRETYTRWDGRSSEHNEVRIAMGVQ